MMNLLYYLSFGLPPFIVVAEVVAAVYLSRKQVKRRVFYVLGSYLLLVALAAFLAYPGDELGYSFIPAFLITGPWNFILDILHLHPLFLRNNIGGTILLGACINCALFCIIDRLSYPKHSARLSGHQAA